MNTPNDITQLVVQFLEGAMTKEEAKAFQDRVDTDEAFGLRVAEEMARHQGRLDLKAELQTIRGNRTPASAAPTARPLTKWLGWAAAFLVVLATALIMVLGQDDYDRVFAQFEPYPPAANLRSTDTPSDSWTEAMDLYDKGDFLQAKLAFDLTLYDFPERAAAIAFYQSQCLMALEIPDYYTALDMLETVPPNSLYYQPAQWYKALALFGAARFEESRNQLQTLANDPHAYNRDQAQELLEDIDWEEWLSPVNP